MIQFSKPTLTGDEGRYLAEVLSQGKLSGDGPFTKKCSEILSNYWSCEKVLLTTSCTHALEMSALLLDIKVGDEVILPSFTFVSTANAFALRGAKLVFVDIDPASMNICVQEVKSAITKNTKVIVPVNYGGWSADLKALRTISDENNITLVEDAAQSICSTFDGKPIGSFGHLSCLSFHDTKNIQCGEGGALIINDRKFIERAEIIREKGTNRSRFIRGQIDKYTWVDIGSSYLPSELNAAVLYGQLLYSDKITMHRTALWNRYFKALSKRFDVPEFDSRCTGNGHIFYIKAKNIEHRQAIINNLAKRNVCATFHYLPLHETSMGKLYGRTHGSLIHTTRESERLLRLPMYHDLSFDQIDYICEAIP